MKGKKRDARAKGSETRAPGTVYVFWLEGEGYGYAFRSAEQYRSALSNALVEFTDGEVPVNEIAAKVDAGVRDLQKFIKVGL